MEYLIYLIICFVFMYDIAFQSQSSPVKWRPGISNKLCQGRISGTSDTFGSFR